MLYSLHDCYAELGIDTTVLHVCLQAQLMMGETATIELVAAENVPVSRQTMYYAMIEHIA